MEPTRISKSPLDKTVSALIYSVSVLTDYLYDREKETANESEAAQRCRGDKSRGATRAEQGSDPEANCDGRVESFPD